MAPAVLMHRAVRALFLVLLIVATLELCTRVEAWWRWDAPFWGSYSSETLRTTDEIGTRNRPGARFEKWAINSAGFRGPELSMVKPAGVFRVGLAGASEVFGLYESPDRELAPQLQARLSAAAPGRFEVVNLAAAGMSPPRIRELFERWAGRFQFDVVVLYPTPAFYLDVDPPMRVSRPAPAARAAAGSRFSARLPDKLWSALREALPSRLQAAMKQVALERVRRAHPPDWVWSSAPRERVELFAADMSELIDVVTRTGATVVLATHANRFPSPPRAEDAAQMLGWIRFYPRASAECLLDMEDEANDAVRRLGRERGLTVVDVQAALGKEARHYADFSHFTDEGAARAAEALAGPIASLADRMQSLAPHQRRATY
jgi:hypothetical protein